MMVGLFYIVRSTETLLSKPFWNQELDRTTWIRPWSPVLSSYGSTLYVRDSVPTGYVRTKGGSSVSLIQSPLSIDCPVKSGYVIYIIT